MFGIELELALAAFAVTLLAGFVKGAVGFAQPMIMISGLATFLPPEMALAALIIPTVVSNVWQSLRDGFAAAWAAMREYWLYLLILGACILASAQLVSVLDGNTMLLILGVPVTLFCIIQLLGFTLKLNSRNRVAEAIFAALAGGVGGISGVWGPLTVIYLNAVDTPKQKSMLVQGVIYGIGAVLLLAAHLRSGVLNAQTLPLSFAMVVPAMLGMAMGLAVHDRLDQKRFKQLTLIVLVFAGLNLIRRGLS